MDRLYERSGAGVFGIRAWLLAPGELAGAFGGALDGLDEGDAQAAFFELEDAVDGAAGGGGDFVLEQRGVRAGFEDHLGGAVGGLRGEQRGDVAGEADVDAGFGEGFDDDVEEGGAGAGEAGDGVHVFLVDDDGAADGGEDLFGECELLIGDEAAAADGGDAGADHGGSVGHGADDGISQPAASSMALVLTEAAKEMRSLAGAQDAGRFRATTSCTCCGLTPSRMMSAALAAARLSVVTAMPNCLARAGAGFG